MNIFHRFLSAVLLAAAVPTVLVQKGEFMLPIPEKMERATQVDDKGLQVWVPFKAEPCVNCKGSKTMQCLHCQRTEDKELETCPECKKTRTATCRVCAGTGEMFDILVRAPCPTCFGAGLTACHVCGGRGRFPVEGSGAKPEKCGCCDTVGGYKCQTCDGKRFVETPAIKPSAAEGKAADIKKAILALEAVAAELAKFESTGDGRKDIKLHDKVVAPGAQFFPPLKRQQKHFEDASKKQNKGAVWKQYSDMVKNQAKDMKQSLDYYLKHQKRVLELCLARAEHNEPLLAKQKK
jgi:hypothetical protein